MRNPENPRKLRSGLSTYNMKAIYTRIRYEKDFDKEYVERQSLFHDALTEFGYLGIQERYIISAHKKGKMARLIRKFDNRRFEEGYREWKRQQKLNQRTRTLQMA